MDLRNLSANKGSIVIARKYILQDRLGGGSFGQIYSAIDRASKNIVAVKLEQRLPNKNPTLPREAKLLSELGEEIGFPTIHNYGKEETFSFLVLGLLGPNLEKLFRTCGRMFSLKTVLMLADQMLTRIEVLHQKDYLHRDIKPDNFCIGHDEDSHNMFMIDFGLSRSYKEVNGQHIPCREKKGLVGTARYASINTHLGKEQSRRDDLESIGYTLIYFLLGELPWQNIKTFEKDEKYKQIAEIKIKTTTEQLCKGLPQEFAVYMDYVKNLEFTAVPDYKFLKRLFRTLFIKNRYLLDYNYDWVYLEQERLKREKKLYKNMRTEMDLRRKRDSSIKIELIKKKAEHDEEEEDVHKDPKISFAPIPKADRRVSVRPDMLVGRESNKKEREQKENKDKVLLKTKTAMVGGRASPYGKKRGIVLELSDKGDTSDNSPAKAFGVTSFSEDMEIATELSANDYLEIKIEQPRVFHINKKNFGITQKRTSRSTISNRKIDQTRETASSDTKQKNLDTRTAIHLNKVRRQSNRSIEKKTSRSHRKGTMSRYEDELSDRSISEWRGDNNLANMMQQKKIIAHRAYLKIK